MNTVATRIAEYLKRRDFTPGTPDDTERLASALAIIEIVTGELPQPVRKILMPSEYGSQMAPDDIRIAGNSLPDIPLPKHAPKSFKDVG